MMFRYYSISLGNEIQRFSNNQSRDWTLWKLAEMAEMAEMAAGSRLSCYDLAALGPRGASQGAAGN